MPLRVRRSYCALATAVLSCLARPALAQAKPDSTPAPISDNSFLIEEAYNQEAGVVQHIFNYRRDRDGAWLATFTQEWPLGGQLDQFSYTLPLQSWSGDGGGLSAAIGDVAINYRRQVLGHDDEPIWFSPRISLVLPTGSTRKGTGAGGPGLQLNLPLSVRVSRALVTHWNAGATATRAHDALGGEATIRTVSAGASAIWLLTPTLNLMLETVWDRTSTPAAVLEVGQRASQDNFVIVPGLRAAINLPRDLQIVPGFGMPLGVGPSSGARDFFLYLSFEHPFH